MDTVSGHPSPRPKSLFSTKTKIFAEIRKIPKHCYVEWIKQIVSPYEEGGQNPHHMSPKVHDLPIRGTRYITCDLKFSSLFQELDNTAFRYSIHDLPFLNSCLKSLARFIENHISLIKNIWYFVCLTWVLQNNPYVSCHIIKPATGYEKKEIEQEKCIKNTEIHDLKSITHVKYW